ncbi:glycosyltransferase family 4 protein [Corynebacterium riegelii]|uniref:glycosyltransferase family 4 protein n=1 Tax=Corynebacterium riegelii TaxID=156976 RepID=UPI000C782A52|nr:glycosyltransferase family 4 protein [Corynebacterium riegelii]PLA10923.1 glycosyltransferase WbuB [Corynebacterium riegelii]
MKILVFSQFWAPTNGVQPRRWQWLSAVLAEQGHELLVISPREKGNQHGTTYSRTNRDDTDLRTPEVGQSGEKILRSKSRSADSSITGKIINQASISLGMLYEAYRSRDLIEEFSPQLLIGTVPSIPTAFVTYTLSKMYKKPYVIDLRDAWPDLLDQSGKWNEGLGKRSVKEAFFRRGPLQLMRVIVRSFLNRVLAKSDGIIVTSQHLESQLADKLKRGGERITTIRNVFPTDSELRQSVARANPPGEFRVLYAGTLGRAQHLLNTLEAVRIAQLRGLNIRLQFVGAGPAKPLLREISEADGLPVEFISRHPSDQLASFYEWSDTALVHLTNWEPLTRTVPSKTYELMEVGKHITAVVAGEAAELIVGLGAGHVVPPEDPEALADVWINLAKDRSLLEVGTRGADWVRYEREKVVPKRLERLLGAISERQR